MSCCPICGSEIGDLGLLILADRGMVARNGFSAALTRQELDILLLLHSRVLRVVQKQAIMDHLYQLSPDVEPEPKILDVFICKMRKKLKPLGVSIQTSWGRGYSLSFDGPSRVIHEGEGE